MVRRLVRCLGLLLIVAALHAQNDATVTGIVTDSESAIIPGVRITLRNVETNIVRAMQTNEEGYFTITSLPPGSYELSAEREGFQTYHETGITLQVGQELRANLKLSIGSVNTTVEVSGAVVDIAPLNTENGMIKGVVVTHAEIDEMPLNGRDFTELALYVPGVVPTSAGGSGSFANINGVRSDATNFLGGRYR